MVVTVLVAHVGIPGRQPGALKDGPRRLSAVPIAKSDRFTSDKKSAWGTVLNDVSLLIPDLQLVSGDGNSGRTGVDVAGVFDKKIWRASVDPMPSITSIPKRDLTFSWSRAGNASPADTPNRTDAATSEGRSELTNDA